MHQRRDALILTSATPHDGKADSFASIIRLLEPTAIADVRDFKKKDIGNLFIRRFQGDVRHAALGQFFERDAAPIVHDATAEEDVALATIDTSSFRTIGRSGNTGALFQTVIRKAWLSSPAACIATIDERLRRLEDPKQGKTKRKRKKRALTPAELAHDRSVLGEIRAACVQVSPDRQAKLQALFAFLEGLGYREGDTGERVVIFSERIDTLEFLSIQLAGRFGIKQTARWKKDAEKWKRGPIAQFHGGMPDQEQYALIQDFSNKNGTIHVLLGSDAAAEGLNLHHACHHLVHYDIPWSLITLEQRNGRIDRYGQDAAPTIRYLLTRPADPELRGDHDILKKITVKADQAAKNLGEVAWVMNLHSADKEEARITRAIEERQDPEAPFVDESDDEGDDWLADVISSNPDDERVPTETHEPLTLFSDDLLYAREAFAQLGLDGHGAQVDWFDLLDGFRLRMPDDLKFRYSYLPPELRRGKEGEIRLTTNRDRVMGAYDKARDTEDGWPDWELFWEQHPVAEWLNDRVLASFRRHEAPIIEVADGIAPGEAAYVFQSIVSNVRSQPVLVDWSAVRRLPLGKLVREPLEALAGHVGLRGPLANSGHSIDTSTLERGIVAAVQEVRTHLDKARSSYERIAAERLRPEVRKLREWRAASKDRLGHVQETMLIRRSERIRELEREREEIDAIYEARRQWIDSTVRVSPTPYIRLAALLVRPT